MVFHFCGQSSLSYAQPPDASSEAHGREQDNNEQHVQEPERPFTPQPEEEPEEPEKIEPSPGLELLPIEEELSYQPQSEEHESENDEQSDIEVQLIEVDEPVAPTREETEQHEEDQQPTSLDDEASEIEAILTPEPLEGSAEGEAREQSTEHEEEESVLENEVHDHEQEMISSPQYTETSHTEQGHEASMNVDTKDRDISVDAETRLPGVFNIITLLHPLYNIICVGKRKVSDSDGADEPEKKRLREESSAATPGEEDRGLWSSKN